MGVVSSMLVTLAVLSVGFFIVLPSVRWVVLSFRKRTSGRN